DAQCARLAHGLDGVLEQVGEQHLEFSRDSHDSWQVLRQRNVRPVLILRQQAIAAQQGMVDVHWLQPRMPRLLASGDQQGFLDDFHGAFNLLPNDVLVALCGRHIGNAAHTHPDNIERRADLMMRLPGGMGDGLTLLAANQLELGLVEAALVLEVKLFQLLERRQSIQYGRYITDQSAQKLAIAAGEDILIASFPQHENALEHLRRRERHHQTLGRVLMSERRQTLLYCRREAIQRLWSTQGPTVLDELVVQRQDRQRAEKVRVQDLILPGMLFFIAYSHHRVCPLQFEGGIQLLEQLAEDVAPAGFQLQRPRQAVHDALGVIPVAHELAPGGGHQEHFQPVCAERPNQTGQADRHGSCHRLHQRQLEGQEQGHDYQHGHDYL